MRALATLVLAALATGCNTDEEGFNWQERSAPASIPPPAVCDVFRGELVHVGSFRPTAPEVFPEVILPEYREMLIHYRIRNLSNEPHVLTTGMGPQVTFEMVDANGNVVAGSHLGVGWPAVAVDYPYGPDETMIHEWHWDLRMENGHRIRPGNYILYVDEWTQCRDVLSTSRAVRVH